MAAEIKKYLGTIGTEKLITNIRVEIAEGVTEAKGYADGLGVKYDPAGTAETKVNALAEGQVKTNKEAIGTMDDLETTSKDTLVKAINEVRNAVSAGGTAAAITLDTSATSAGASKTYTLKQGDNVVGAIDIPKDMVVQSGEVVVDPAGQAAGTYIKLVLANATNDEIYVNVGTLVDIYKAKASATQVQLAIDASTREISATIVAGSITDVELAANCVTTAKIADGNVTKAKLSTELQASIDKADGAAADAQAKADAALESAKAYADQAEADAVSTAAADATTKAGTAENNAKAHADGLNTAMDTRVQALEEVSYVEITADEVDAMFNA